MLNSELEAYGGPRIMKFAAAAAAMAVLAGCAVTMPFPPLTTSFQGSPDSHAACKPASKCSSETTNSRLAYRRQKPVDDGKIDNDPPDFIVNSGARAGGEADFPSRGRSECQLSKRARNNQRWTRVAPKGECE
jgi:hypothetical protein